MLNELEQDLQQDCLKSESLQSDGYRSTATLQPFVLSWQAVCIQKYTSYKNCEVLTIKIYIYEIQPIFDNN